MSLEEVVYIPRSGVERQHGTSWPCMQEEERVLKESLEYTEMWLQIS